MTYNSEIHHRRSIRLKEYNYAQNGTYFLTTCTKERECLFGELDDGCMVLNKFGKIVESVWTGLINHYKNVVLDTFVIMPNHVHGIITLQIPVGAGLKPAQIKTSTVSSSRYNSAHLTKRPSLSEIVRGFKTFSSRKINETRRSSGNPVWQRNYYERIIRDESELEEIRDYIVYNPLKWALDSENPNVVISER